MDKYNGPSQTSLTSNHQHSASPYQSQAMTQHPYQSAFPQDQPQNIAMATSNPPINPHPQRSFPLRNTLNGHSNTNLSPQVSLLQPHSQAQLPTAQPNYPQRQPQNSPYPPYQPAQQTPYQSQLASNSQSQQQQPGIYPSTSASRQASLGNTQSYPNPYSNANRYPPLQPPPPPLRNVDPSAYNRTQSLISSAWPPQVSPPSSGQPWGMNNNLMSLSPAQTLRQQHYQHAASRQTSQGRVVPENWDERSMSLSSFPRPNQLDQSSNSRVIPMRNRESYETVLSDNNHQSLNTPSSGPSVTRQRSDSQASSATATALPPRTVSMASTLADTTLQPTHQLQQHKTSQKGLSPQQRTPLVYPAFLSRVAEAFKLRIVVSDHHKDGLDYKSAFTGEDAVTLIAYIIKTTDRNLALLLGRSLDAQKFFHDVTYLHRLRDKKRDLKPDLYQFRDASVEGNSEVNGVFTLLTECYSPTCTKERLCYSIACPRRLEQQANLKIKPQPGLKRNTSTASLHDDATDEQKLWINTVSKEIADKTPEREKKRQEVISELAYTERDFVKDLEYMRDFWMIPLRDSGTTIPGPRRHGVIQSIFSNVLEVLAVNSILAEAITRRQQENPVVYSIGDIFLQNVPKFSPFIKYGAGQLFGKHEFENERKINPVFSKFVDETERRKESRKLELNGYLTKPTTRLARYPLLLDAVLRATADDNPDKQDLPKAITQIKQFLSQVNVESGKAENRMELIKLDHQLKWPPRMQVDLELTEPSRQLLYTGKLKKYPQDSQCDFQIYIFDNRVLLVRLKPTNKKEHFHVYRKPIELELLTVPEISDVLPNQSGFMKRPSTSLSLATAPVKDTKVAGFPITFDFLGKDGYNVTLFCSTPPQQKEIIEHISAQQKILFSRSNVYTKSMISRNFFSSIVRIHCCVPIDGGLKLVIGTEAGVYVLDRKLNASKPRRVLECKSVTCIDVLEQHQMLLILSDKVLYLYSTEALDPDESIAASNKRGVKICSANYFNTGICSGLQLVCAAKHSGVSTTVKIFKPKDTIAKKSKKSAFSKLMASNQSLLDNSLEQYGERYIPAESSNICFLRSKICVCTTRGFEIVSLEDSGTQSLLNMADSALDFIGQDDKPLHFERIGSDYNLLCYSNFSLYVNRYGWRAKPDWRITWHGSPTSFAVFNPYILAFDPNFIEIFHLETCKIVHIITGKNIRMIHSSSREILYAYEDENGVDVICSLDFWAPGPSSTGIVSRHDALPLRSQAPGNELVQLPSTSNSPLDPNAAGKNYHANTFQGRESEIREHASQNGNSESFARQQPNFQPRSMTMPNEPSRGY